MKKDVFELAKEFFEMASATPKGKKLLASDLIDQEYLFKMLDDGSGFSVKIKSGEVSVDRWTPREIDWGKEIEKVVRIDIKSDEVLRNIFKGLLTFNWVHNPYWLLMGGRRIHRPGIVMLTRIGRKALKKKALEAYEI